MISKTNHATRPWRGGGALLAAIGLVLTFGSGCTNVKFGSEAARLELAVPAPLADVEPMIVTRRLSTTFGPFTARKQRGSGRRWTLPMGDLSYSEESFRLWFQLTEEGGPERPVECLGDDRYARLGSLTVRRALKEGESVLICAEIDDSGEELWRLVVENRRDSDAGYVRIGEREWRLVRGEPVTPLPDDDGVGFLLFDDERALAAVELAGRGRVWIAPELSASDRHAAGAVAAAMSAFVHRRQD